MIFMVPVRISAPEKTPVSLSEAKAHLRVDVGVEDFDAQITGFIKAATAHLEKSLGYALVTQTWHENFAGFWCPLRLSMRPVNGGSVAVKYFDAANAPQTLASTSYAVFGDLISFHANGALPSTFGRADAVTVEYDAGVAAEDVPEDLKVAILLHTGFLFGARESQTEKPWQSTGAYEALTFPYRLLQV